jgi:WD40 repeat protein
MMHRLLAGILVLVSLGLWCAPTPAAAAECVTFPETGRRICDRFLEYWRQNGGLSQQGLPLTDLFDEVNPTDGKTYKTQYFERARFELHPDNAAPYEVLLGLLGLEQFAPRYPGVLTPVPGDPFAGDIGDRQCERFDATNETVCGPFLRYWHKHGGLAQQGYPISPVFLETNLADGKQYPTQYFERARFEYHPENANTPYAVLLGHLGREQHRRYNSYPDDVEWSSQGLLAAGYQDGTLRLWRADGTLQALLVGHTDPFFALAWSPDGQILASVSHDRTVRLWNAAGAALATLRGHSIAVDSLAWSPDGRILATGDRRGSICLWAPDGTLLATLQGHTNSITALAWSPDSQNLASGSFDKSVRLWSAEGTPRAVLTAHTDVVSSLAWSPDGTTLASSSWDETARLWLANGTPVATLVGHAGVAWLVAWSPDGRFLLSGDDQGAIRFWSPDGVLIKTLLGHTKSIKALVWSPDGRILASAGFGDAPRYWTSDGTPLVTLQEHAAGMRDIAWSPDGRMLASAANDGAVCLWDADGKLLGTLSTRTSRPR